MLVSYLRSLVSDSSVIDDLFQETMIVAWRRIDDYDRERPFGPWLRGIARKLVLAHHRRSAANPRWCAPDVLEALDRRFEELGRRPGDTFRDRVDRLVDCMAKLPSRMRQVIELMYARSLLLRQIATALDEQEEAIKKRAQRARRQLLECLMSGEAST